MKLRFGFVYLACAALVAAGCGGGDGGNGDDGGGDKDAKSPKKTTTSKAERAVADDRENKEEQVKEAKKTFADSDDDIGACRNLAMSYVALASPASTGDPKNPPKVPEDREENMKRAIDTLEKCRKIDSKDRDVQQMLASSYMGTNQYEKAATLLEQLARTAKGPERANAYYAWGLAASNAQQFDDAIAAWERFVELAPPKDPRVAQIRQSINALRAAQRQPQPAAAPDASGGEASAGESKEADDEG